MTIISLNRDRQRIIDEMTYLSAVEAVSINHKFEYLEHIAQMLMYSHEIPDMGLPDSILSRNRSVRPFFSFDPSTYLPQYGDVIKGTNFYNRFFWRGHNCILLRSSSVSPSQYLVQRRMAHSTFQPVTRNFYWRKPEYISGHGWIVSIVAPGDRAENILSVKLSDLLSPPFPLKRGGISIWLDKNSHILPFSSVPDKLQLLLDTHLLQHNKWQQIGGYLVFRTALHGPGWQQIVLYPLGDVLTRSLHIITKQLPYELIIMIVTVFALGWLLHHYMIRPLWKFSDIIGKTKPDSLTMYLPENSQDELGRVARAYNRLLDTLRVQNEKQENKVAERTRALKEAKKLAEQANKHINPHITTISHELRTPLNGALGAIELLRDSGLNTKQKNLVDTAQQCTSTLLTIINNLLDFSRIESNHFSLHIEEIALLPVLDKAMQTIQGPAQNKNLALRTFVGPYVPLHLEADATRLQQILVNLLGNALKFTETGGICLTVKRCEEQLIFAVSDSGKGLSSQYQDDVFIPFFQAEGVVQGTGLGLTISLSLAKMMGGRLEFYSTLGLGTCVSLLLPLKKYQPPQPIGGELAAPLPLHRQLTAWGINCSIAKGEGILSDSQLRFLPGKLYSRIQQILFGAPVESDNNISVQPWRLNVLLVDDSDINRDIISMMLCRLGQDVTTAGSSNEALCLGQQQRFDLVLMDIRMPEINGIECVQIWRCDPENKDPECLIIALSASTATEEITRCQGAGINHCLAKPVTLTTLANSINIAAEFQLRRDIELQEQDPYLSCAVWGSEDTLMCDKIQHSLDTLLTEIEHTLPDKQKACDLLHKLKGCLGQAGFSELVCHVVDMENRLRHELDISVGEITELRQSITAQNPAQYR